jgi:type II secretory pathway component PulK
MKTVGNRKGLVLIGVLWVVVVLMVIAVSTGRKSRLDTKVCVAATQDLRCKWASRAGVEKAIAVLKEDYGVSDSLSDYWSDNPADFNDVALQDCRFTVRVIDESSKLNVNRATKEQLMSLEYMTDAIADAILDWRDDDDDERAEGAEEGYYQNLPYGYAIANGPFGTIRELLCVKGVTQQLLYGEDTNFNGKLDFNEMDGDESWPYDNGDEKLDKGWIAYLTCYSYDKNVDGFGNSRVNISSAGEGRLRRSLNISRGQAKWIVEKRDGDGFQSIGDLISDNSPERSSSNNNGGGNRGGRDVPAEPVDTETFKRIADQITIRDEREVEGRVNINTAPVEVLKALFGGDNSAESLANDVVVHRNGLIDGMGSIADILDVKSMTKEKFKKIADMITVRSDIYTVRCFAEAQSEGIVRTTLRTEAVVDRGATPSSILYWYQGVGPYFANYSQTGQ